MSYVNEELPVQLKQCDRKRKQLDFAADLRYIPSLSRTSVDAMQSIRGDAVKQVHKNMQQMIDCLLVFMCLTTKLMLPPAKFLMKLSADALPLVQTQLGLVCFLWPQLISSGRR